MSRTGNGTLIHFLPLRLYGSFQSDRVHFLAGRFFRFQYLLLEHGGTRNEPSPIIGRFLLVTFRRFWRRFYATGRRRPRRIHTELMFNVRHVRVYCLSVDVCAVHVKSPGNQTVVLVGVRLDGRPS